MTLVAECRAWTHTYSKAMTEHAARQMDEILDVFNPTQKRLALAVKDLEDMRSQVDARAKICKADINLEITITPIEESYALLNRYTQAFNDGNAVHVDSLSYQI